MARLSISPVDTPLLCRWIWVGGEQLSAQTTSSSSAARWRQKLTPEHEPSTVLTVCWDSDQNLPVTDAEVRLVSALLQHLNETMLIEDGIEASGSIQAPADMILGDTGV
jgi:hypothetical protein